MPHKKNPIAAENLTGVARLLRANLHAALETWRSGTNATSVTPPWSVIPPDSTTLASYATRRLTRVLKNLVVNESVCGRT